MSDPSVQIYTSANCSFCNWAKKLLARKQAEYREFRVDTDEVRREEMVRRAKRTSVPQIFIGDYHVGGYQEMVELDQDGRLDELLRGAAPPPAS